MHWRTVGSDEFPDGPFDKTRLLETYKNVPHRWSTADDKRRNIERMVVQNRTILGIVILWFIVIPVTVSLLDFFSFKVSLVTTGFSVIAGAWKLAGYMGWRKKSKRQQEKAAEELRMKHHHYYCERNPEGFNRIKAEVLDREIRDNVRKEVEELRNRKEHPK